MSKVLREAVKVSYEYPEITIPDKPSELIRGVMEDMRKVGKLRHVKFDMATWCETDLPGGKCSVCAAGAWLYAKANFPKESEEMERIGEFIDDMSSGNDGTYRVMSAIDELRRGDPAEFFSELDEVYVSINRIDRDEITLELEKCFTRTYNEDNPQSVIAAFNKCAKVMESHGI